MYLSRDRIKKIRIKDRSNSVATKLVSAIKLSFGVSGFGLSHTEFCRKKYSVASTTSTTKNRKTKCPTLWGVSKGCTAWCRRHTIKIPISGESSTRDGIENKTVITHAMKINTSKAFSMVHREEMAAFHSSCVTVGR